MVGRGRDRDGQPGAQPADVLGSLEGTVEAVGDRAGGPIAGLGQQHPEAAAPSRTARSVSRASARMASATARAIAVRLGGRRAVGQLDEQDGCRPSVAVVTRGLVAKRGGPVLARVELDRSMRPGRDLVAAPPRRARGGEEGLDVLVRALARLLVVMMLGEHELPGAARPRRLGRRCGRGGGRGRGVVRVGHAQASLARPGRSGGQVVQGDLDERAVGGHRPRCPARSRP